MLRFFMKRGYTPLVCDTDGMNFSLPEGGVDDRRYIGKGNNWLVKEGKEYEGYDADVAEFNDRVNCLSSSNRMKCIHNIVTPH